MKENFLFFLKYFFYEKSYKDFIIIVASLIFTLSYLSKFLKGELAIVIFILLAICIYVFIGKFIQINDQINEWYDYQNLNKDSKPKTEEKPKKYLLYLFGIILTFLLMENIILIYFENSASFNPTYFILFKIIDFITQIGFSDCLNVIFELNVKETISNATLILFNLIFDIISIFMITNIFHDFLYKKDLYNQIQEFDYQGEHYDDIKTNGFKNSRTGQILLEKMDRSIKEFLMILDIQKDVIFDVTNIFNIDIDEDAFISAQKKIYVCQYFLNKTDFRNEFDQKIRKKFEIYFFKMIEIQENKIYPTTMLIDTLNVLNEFENEYHDEAKKFIEKYINIAKTLKEEEEVKMISEFLKFLGPEKFQRYEELVLNLVEINNNKKMENMTQLYQQNMSSIMKKLKDMIEKDDSIIKKNDENKANKFIEKNSFLKKDFIYVERKIIPKLIPETNIFQEIKLININLSLSEINYQENEQYIMIMPFFVANHLVSRKKFEEWVGNYVHLELKEGFFPIQKYTGEAKNENASVHWLTAILFTKNPSHINSEKNKPQINCRLLNFYEWLYIIKENKIKMKHDCCEWSNNLIQNQNQSLPFILNNKEDFDLKKISRRNYITYMYYDHHHKIVQACKGDIITEYLSRDISFRLVYDIV